AVARYEPLWRPHRRRLAGAPQPRRRGRAAAGIARGGGSGRRRPRPGGLGGGRRSRSSLRADGFSKPVSRGQAVTDGRVPVAFGARSETPGLVLQGRAADGAAGTPGADRREVAGCRGNVSTAGFPLAPEPGGTSSCSPAAPGTRRCLPPPVPPPAVRRAS